MPVVTRLSRRGAIALLFAGGILLASHAADAQTRPLDAPRAAGIVGERYDGFAVVRGAAPPDIASLVATVNGERRVIYEQRAAAQKVSVDAVGRIYAVEIMKSAPAKTWFMTESGQWTQK